MPSKKYKSACFMGPPAIFLSMVLAVVGAGTIAFMISTILIAFLKNDFFGITFSRKSRVRF